MKITAMLSAEREMVNCDDEAALAPYFVIEQKPM